MNLKKLFFTNSILFFLLIQISSVYATGEINHNYSNGIIFNAIQSNNLATNQGYALNNIPFNLISQDSNLAINKNYSTQLQFNLISNGITASIDYNYFSGRVMFNKITNFNSYFGYQTSSTSFILCGKSGTSKLCSSFSANPSLNNSDYKNPLKNGRYEDSLLDFSASISDIELNSTYNTPFDKIGTNGSTKVFCVKNSQKCFEMTNSTITYNNAFTLPNGLPSSNILNIGEDYYYLKQDGTLNKNSSISTPLSSRTNILQKLNNYLIVSNDGDNTISLYDLNNSYSLVKTITGNSIIKDKFINTGTKLIFFGKNGKFSEIDSSGTLKTILYNGGDVITNLTKFSDSSIVFCASDNNCYNLNTDFGSISKKTNLVTSSLFKGLNLIFKTTLSGNNDKMIFFE